MTWDYMKPVHLAYCADPFVLRVADDLYYAFGTGTNFDLVPDDGRKFALLRSHNLFDWEYLGGALIPPVGPEFGTDFWAPEVARGDDGRFYLYYSVGRPGEEGHQLRVAESDVPEGPYHDAGGPALVDPATCPFAIDAHPFRDSDGQWYLFYARDFLDTDDGFRAGTGLVLDKLVSMTQLAGEERVVMRARHDWQLFEARRQMRAYGNAIFDWHTLEGAFVVRHDDRYWCFYSGAAYQTPNYGVDYAVADTIWGPYSEAGGEETPRVLRTIPDRLRGPGHNSVVVGPDGNTEYLVFHAWNADHRKRQMYLVPLEWTTDGPRAEFAASK